MVEYSIIVPAYNEEERIRDCLVSLKQQSFRDYEIIVVNNNSTDRTAEIAAGIVGKIHNEKKQGYVFAVNHGVRLAKGRFLSICDADSIYPPDWLSRMHAEFSRDPSVVAVYGSTAAYDAGFIINLISGPLYTAFLLISRLFGLDNTSGFNFAYRKDAFLKVGGFDPHYLKAGPDVILGEKLKKHGKVRLNLSIAMRSSARRFRKKGWLKTLVLFFSIWKNLLLKRDPQLSYKEYNK